MTILWDSSALISLLDETRSTHEAALECYWRLREEGELQIISSIAISELAVKNNPEPIFLEFGFQVQDFNIRHAIEAANVKKITMVDKQLRSEQNTRAVIVNDSQIIGQALAEQVDYILTEDQNTFCKTVSKLHSKLGMSLQALLLSDDPLGKIGYTQRLLPLDI